VILGDAKMRKKEVIEFFGGVKSTAIALRISEQAVRKWPEILGKSRAYHIELVSLGKLVSEETKKEMGIK
jgi:hypothetical protein